MDTSKPNIAGLAVSQADLRDRAPYWTTRCSTA